LRRQVDEKTEEILDLRERLSALSASAEAEKAEPVAWQAASAVMAALKQAADITGAFCACDDPEEQEEINFILQQRAQRIINLKHDVALQALVDQAQELDMGYATPPAPSEQVEEAGASDEQLYEVAIAAWKREQDEGRSEIPDCLVAAARAAYNRAALAASTSAGQAVPVAWPRKATAEMAQEFKRAYKDGSIWSDRLDYAIEAMLAAAPPSPPLQEPATQAMSDEEIDSLWDKQVSFVAPLGHIDEIRDFARSLARTATEVPEGWKLMPMVPTEKMLLAAGLGEESGRLVYKSFLMVSPTFEAQHD
jgi:hypothetical protein